MNDYIKYWMILVLMIAILFSVLASLAIGVSIGSDNVTMTKDSRDYRRLELELADVKARLATLERIRIEVELKDKSGTWFVLNGKVQ
jgi:hypothetical protein